MTTFSSALTNTLQPPMVSAAPASAPAPAQVSSTVPGATPAYVPETASPNTTRATGVGPLPSKQETMLKDIADLALSYSQPVAPGQVTAQQQQVLSAWRNNAQSDYGQFMANQGLSVVSSNPGVLFNEELATAQSQWSMEDAKGALSMLGLSAKDWDQYEKLREEDAKRHGNFIFGAVEFVAGALITYFSFGTLGAVGIGMMAQGGSQMMGNS